MKYLLNHLGKLWIALFVITLVVAVAACSATPASPSGTSTSTSPGLSSATSPLATTSAPAASSRAASPSTTASPSLSPTLTSSPSSTASLSPGAFSVNIMSKANIGNYLVNGNGMTLYYYANDSVGVSTVQGNVLQNWPAFYVASVTAPSSLNASDFGTITRSDGQKQTTYKGWPLYLFIQDKVPGDTNGNGLNGIWFVVNPDRFPPQISIGPSVSPTSSATRPSSTATGAATSTTPSSGY